jgi:hypothetical protein
VGYRPKRKIYNLDFAGTDYEGLHASLRGFTVGEELEIDATEFSGDLLVRTLAARLISWNVEDDNGNPVPATFEGVCTQDSAMVMAILSALRQANSGVPDPLPQPSPSGETSLAPPIPMAPLSESPQNSAVPA